jgi:myosin heavy subunit
LSAKHLITVAAPLSTQDMFFGRPIGLFALLDEESNFPKATDITLGNAFVLI